MIRRRNAILLAAGLLAPLALVGRPAGAIDQDLVVSATTGPPGTEVTVSSASCVAPPDGDVSLDVSFFTGTAPNQQIAAFASGYEGSATITILKWRGPDFWPPSFTSPMPSCMRSTWLATSTKRCHRSRRSRGKPWA